ncbi:hypothetical protein H5410_040331 [Solanum commersonii]|uniref:Endonuclease/exonuclease/phosphatase domain-containing protein n=1 Tax=Solanum commersonii TaxID=4109 RepID=A0A9J5XNL5_SOLCO|nr:hypothetical protein H5410_040331 [Solanum commersonii]
MECKGLNNRDKRRLIKIIWGGWNADIICLQEIKLEGDVIEEGLCPQLLCGTEAWLGGNKGAIRGLIEGPWAFVWRFQCGEVHLKEEKLFEKEKRHERIFRFHRRSEVD